MLEPHNIARTSFAIAASPPRMRALVMGLNYAGSPSVNELFGCVNDAHEVALFLRTRYSPAKMAVEVVTDADPKTKKDTTFTGMLNKLYAIATASWRDRLEFVYIHYSGHGTFVKDDGEEKDGDELDGRDECLVPSDAHSAGVIRDDIVAGVFRCFNPKTRVVVVFDCCHSGTMGDLPFSWPSTKTLIQTQTQQRSTSSSSSKVITTTQIVEKQDQQGVRVENKAAVAAAASSASSAASTTPSALPRIIAVSGCMDDETAADAIFSVPPKDPKRIMPTVRYAGAMTTCLLNVLSSSCSPVKNSNANAATNNNVFDVVDALRAALVDAGFGTQRPVLTSSYNLARDPAFLPSQ